MRILFYAVNGLGLGHVTRLLAIARQIRRIRPLTDILFITSSEADSVIYQEGFPAVKVPSKNIARESGMRARLHARILHQSTWAVFSAFNPKITVVDTFPLGFTFELEPVLTWKTCPFAFIYRHRKLEKAQNKRFQSAMEKYDLVIVPHEKEGFDAPLPQEVPNLFAGNIIIRDKKELLPKPQAIRELGLPHPGPKDKYALITLGGGGQEGMEKVLDNILPLFKEYPHIHPCIAQGNLQRDHYSPAGCRVLKNHYPLCRMYNAFDYIIAGSGYNTVNECLYFNKPSLFLPFERLVDDQFQRVRRLREAGLALTADPFDAKDIAENFKQLADPEQYDRMLRALKKKKFRNNAAKAARAILKLADKK